MNCPIFEPGDPRNNYPRHLLPSQPWIEPKAFGPMEDDDIEKEDNGLLTVTEAAKVYGYSRSGIFGAMFNRGLPATKIGKMLYIKIEDMEAYVSTEHKVGRKPGTSKVA